MDVWAACGGAGLFFYVLLGSRCLHAYGSTHAGATLPQHFKPWPQRQALRLKIAQKPIENVLFVFKLLKTGVLRALGLDTDIPQPEPSEAQTRDWEAYPCRGAQHRGCPGPLGRSGLKNVSSRQGLLALARWHI